MLLKLSRIRGKRHKRTYFRERVFYFKIFESYGSVIAEGAPGGALDPPEFFKNGI